MFAALLTAVGRAITDTLPAAPAAPAVGHLVLWPCQFLSETNLDTKVTEKENYLPKKIVQ